MAESTVSTPRVTAPLLDSFVGRNVMLVGTVTQLRGDSAIIDSDGNVTVILNREAHLTSGNAVQVIGKVNPDLSVKVLNSTDMGPNFDFNLYRSVVEVSHLLKPVFVYDN